MRESGWCPQGSSRGNDRFQGVHKTIFRERERERENNKRKIGCIWLQNVFTKKKNKNSGFPSPTSMCTWKSRKFVPGQPLSKHMWKKLVFLTYSWHILTCLADRLSDGNVCACLLFGPFVSPKCWVKRGHLPLLWMVTFEPGPGNADMWNTQVTWQRSPVLACWRDRCPKIIRLLLKNKMSYLYKSFGWIHVYGTSISLSRCSLISHAVIQSHHEVLLLRARASQVGAKLGRPTLQEFHMEPAQTCFLSPDGFSLQHCPCWSMFIHFLRVHWPCEILRVQSRTLHFFHKVAAKFEEPQLPEASMALLWNGAGSAAALSETAAPPYRRPTGGLVVCWWLKIGQQSKGENRGGSVVEIISLHLVSWSDWESGHHVHCYVLPPCRILSWHIDVTLRHLDHGLQRMF